MNFASLRVFVVCELCTSWCRTIFFKIPATDKNPHFLKVRKISNCTVRSDPILWTTKFVLCMCGYSPVHSMYIHIVGPDLISIETSVYAKYMKYIFLLLKIFLFETWKHFILVTVSFLILKKHVLDQARDFFILSTLISWLCLTRFYFPRFCLKQSPINHWIQPLSFSLYTREMKLYVSVQASRAGQDQCSKSIKLLLPGQRFLSFSLDRLTILRVTSSIF